MEERDGGEQEEEEEMDGEGESLEYCEGEQGDGRKGGRWGGN